MKKTATIIFMIICLSVFIFSGYKIISWYLANKENKKINEETKQAITITKGKVKVDFEKLKKQNSDAIAYLKVNNTNINYVVTKTTNNDYYLNHNFNKDYNISGWVFADYRNNFDDTDKNIIIYGHNTMDDSMFGSLKNILKKDWYTNQDNLKITLITENKEYKYKVFSIYQIEAEDYYIKTKFESNEFIKFVNEIKSRSIHDFKEELNNDDIILTLSTCSQTGKERVVLHAKQIT